MDNYLYSKWDGTQNIFEPDVDSLMDELQRNLMYDGDLAEALRMMQRDGLTDNQGRRLPSLREFLERLRQRRQEHLERYKLNSVMDEIRQRLGEIIQKEKQSIQDRLESARQKSAENSQELNVDVREKLLKNLEERASQSMDKLENLPAHPASVITIWCKPKLPSPATTAALLCDQVLRSVTGSKLWVGGSARAWMPSSSSKVPKVSVMCLSRTLVST